MDLDNSVVIVGAGAGVDGDGGWYRLVMGKIKYFAKK